MFNLGFGELVLLAVIGLIVIGPKQLPQIAKTLARTINEFKKAINEVSNSVTNELTSSSDSEKNPPKENNKNV